jgi:hypothetical protein
MPTRRKSGGADESALPAAVRRKLNDVRLGLLALHKALLDYQRIRYERTHGRIESSGAFLQLAIHDPQFAWLRPVSELVVQLDELLVSDEPGAEVDADTITAHARTLLRADENGGDFQRQYHRALQDSPEVVMAHAQWKRLAGVK